MQVFYGTPLSYFLNQLGGAYIDGATGVLYQYATYADDVLSLTDADDAMDGALGDDMISGLGGDDSLRGHDGDDTLDGGNGADLLAGGAGRDLLIGGDGDDTLDGGDGNDLLRGGDGMDIIRGGAGNDTIHTGAGGGTVRAGDGNDKVVVGAGEHFVLGGSGTDTFVFDWTSGDTEIGDFDHGWQRDRIDLRGFEFGDRAGLEAAAETFMEGDGSTTFVIAIEGGPRIAVNDDWFDQDTTLDDLDILF
ncbi:MAG: calcium-binding protein [Paracoccaceae bacterium]